MRLLSLSLLACCAGCAGIKAVDTTSLADYATRGESHVTYSVVPGSIAGMPEGTVAIPTVPGKDVTFRSWYPTGQPQWELTTQRSAVLDVLLSGLSDVDAAKFAADAATRQWTMELIDRAIALAQPLLAAAAQPAPAPAPDKLDRIIDALERIVPPAQP